MTEQMLRLLGDIAARQLAIEAKLDILIDALAADEPPEEPPEDTTIEDLEGSSISLPKSQEDGL